MPACKQDSSGNCTLDSTKDQLKYGADVSTYMDETNADGKYANPYHYKSPCGTDCDQGWISYGSTSDGCSSGQERQKCVVDTSEFAGVGSCCTGQPANPNDMFSAHSCKFSGYGGNNIVATKDGRYAPWSSDCTKHPDGITAIQNYCAGADTKGNPLLDTVQNCKTWCTKNKADCDSAKAVYCGNYPKNSYCNCYNTKCSSMFKDCDKSSGECKTNALKVSGFVGGIVLLIVILVLLFVYVF